MSNKLKRSCDNCEFFYVHERSSELSERCVRFPPQVFFRRSDPGNNYNREFAAVFPWIPEPRWCGEFKAADSVSEDRQ
jgi:hypothetical protein